MQRDNTQLYFTPLTPQQVPALAALCADAPDPWTALQLEAELAKPQSYVFVASRGQTPVAFAAFGLVGDTRRAGTACRGGPKPPHRCGKRAFDARIWCIATLWGKALLIRGARIQYRGIGAVPPHGVCAAGAPQRGCTPPRTRTVLPWSWCSMGDCRFCRLGDLEQGC